MAVGRTSKAEELSARIGSMLATLASDAPDGSNENDAINRAKNVGNRYTLCAFPEGDTPLKNNMVYIKWGHDGSDEWFISYVFQNAIGAEDVGNASKYDGRITSTDLPDLTFDPEKSAVEYLRSFTLDILKILSDRNQIAFDINHIPAKKNRDAVLKDLLAARDQAALHTHFGENEKEKNLFKLYYGLMRLKFCLDQFAMLKQPEQLMKEVEGSLNTLNYSQTILNRRGVEVLQTEYNLFSSIFKEFVGYMQGGSKRISTPIKSGQYLDLDKVVKVMQEELKVFHDARQKFVELDKEAHADANAGNEVALKSTLRLIQTQRNNLENAKKRFADSIAKYIETFQFAIGDTQKALGTDKKPSVFNQSIKDAYPIQAYALYYLDLVECTKEQNYDFLPEDSKDSFESLTRLSKGDRIAKLLQEIASYVSEYQTDKNRLLVADACDARLKLEDSLKLSGKTCKTLARNLVQDKEVLNQTVAIVATRDEKPYQELLNLKANGVVALLRRHWWKMLIGAVVLTAVMAAVAVFALHLVVGAIFVGLVSAAVGAAIGFGAGKITDKCYPMELNDDDLNVDNSVRLNDMVVRGDSPSGSPASSRPQTPRGSTASVTLTTSESYEESLKRVAAEGNEILAGMSSGGEASIVIDDDAPKNLTKQSSDYNPFAHSEDEGLRLDLDKPKRGKESTNPFDGLPASTQSSSPKSVKKPQDFNDDYANPFASL